MKYTSFFVGMINFIIVMQSYAMEKEESAFHIVNKSMKKPYCAQYLTNNSVVVGHKNGCSVLDITNDKELIKISDVPCYKVAVHPDKKKIAFCGDKTIGVYNVETDKHEWSTSEDYDIDALYFNSYDNTLIVYLQHSNMHNHIITKRDCLGNAFSDKAIITNQVSNAFCLEKQIFCILEDYGDVLSLYNVSNLELEPKKINYTPANAPYNLYHRCGINSEGSVAIREIGENFITMIMNAHQDDHAIISLHALSNETFSRMFFYPKSPILLTILNIDSNAKIQYWDIKTKQSISAIEAPSFNQYIRDFSFSPDRREAMFTVVKKCMTLAVPFEVVYESITKEKFLMYLLFLNRYCYQQNKNIPEDIIKFMGSVLLETFKR